MIGQALTDGVLTGAVIGLGAIGVSFTMQIMRFANFSHAELLTWGGYLALLIVGFIGAGAPTAGLSFGWQLLAAALLAAALTGLLAWMIDRLVFRRLRGSGAHHLTLVFASFGLGLVMRHLVVLLWGHESRFYTRELQIANEVLPGIRVLPDQIFILLLTLLIVAALHLFLTYSRTGIAMRAAAESPGLSQACGIDVERVIRNTWLIGGGLAALAGVFTGLTPQLNPENGASLLLALFSAAILGGIGSLPGAVVGGLFVGIAENVMLLVVSPGFKQAMPFMLLLLVLVLRPQGLFGERREGDR
ncbi:MAG: branched-chain amino acid ABC transporter permease [Rhizobacter sp.]|nr:branched-chain amino acid ABC transporter permease [Rhizobacter sp.]